MLPALFHWRPDGCRACPFGPLFAARLCASAAQRSRCAALARRVGIAPPRRAGARRSARSPTRGSARSASAAGALREARRAPEARVGRRPRRKKGPLSYGGLFSSELLRGNDFRGRAAGAVSRARSGPRSGRTLDTVPAVCNLVFLGPEGPPEARCRAAQAGADPAGGLFTCPPCGRRSRRLSGASGERQRVASAARETGGGEAAAPWPCAAYLFAGCRATRQRAGRGTGAPRARRAEGPYPAAAGLS